MKTESISKRTSLALMGVAATLLLIAIMAASRPAIAQTNAAPSPAPPPGKDAEIEALKKEIEVLKGKVPDQSHAMKDVAYHFANLWFAGQKHNWPLAKFYCDETRAHLKWAVRIIPVRKARGADLDLRLMLDGLDQSLFAALQKTIDAKNADDFTKAYRQALDGCYSCHVAAEKPFLRLHVPEQPEARIIEFAPAE
jgi:hypothetical protein